MKTRNQFNSFGIGAVVLASAVGGLAMFVPAVVNADTIIYDPLAYSGSNTTLNGTEPSNYGGSDSYNPSDTWFVASANNGGVNSFTRESGGTVNGSAGGSGHTDGTQLLFTPTAGNIYYLSVTISNLPASNGDWLAIGFGGAEVNSQDANMTTSSTSGKDPWMYVGGGASSAGGQIFSGGTAGGAGAGYSAASSHVFEVELDAQTNPSSWAAYYYVDGVETGSGYTGLGNLSSTIKSVYIANYNTAVATWSNFTLTETPEPASLGLIMVAGVGMLTRRRRA